MLGFKPLGVPQSLFIWACSSLYTNRWVPILKFISRNIGGRIKGVNENMRIILEVLRNTLKDETIDESSALGRSKRWDSLKHIQVIFALEKRFGLKIGPKNISQLVSVMKILEFIEAHSLT